jgi:hypothetical protein
LNVFAARVFKEMRRSFLNKAELLQIFENLLPLEFNGILYVYYSDAVVTEGGKPVLQLSGQIASVPFKSPCSVYGGRPPHPKNVTSSFPFFPTDSFS